MDLGPDVEYLARVQWFPCGSLVVLVCNGVGLRLIVRALMGGSRIARHAYATSHLRWFCPIQYGRALPGGVPGMLKLTPQGGYRFPVVPENR